MIENDSFLRSLLTDHYAIHEARLQPTSGGSEADRSVLIVQQGDTRNIMRVFPPENTRSNPTALAQVLNLLAEADFPAERIIPAINGDSVVTVDGWRVVLTSFIESTPTDQLDSEFFGLGATLGRLHALFTPEDLLARDIPIAERSLDAEMGMARDDLLAVPRPDDAQLGAFYDELLAAIDATDRCHDLPYTLIHNDFQPGNVLRTTDASLGVIDWDGSGRSPAIVDLGYLIANIHPEGLLRPDVARIHALLDGYLQHNSLSQTEIERLPDMIRFRPITYLTSDFGNYLAHLDNPDPSYVHCIAIYRTVDEAATIAREYWERQNLRYADTSERQGVKAKVEALHDQLTINNNKIQQLANSIVHFQKSKSQARDIDKIGEIMNLLERNMSRLVTLLSSYDKRLPTSGHFDSNSFDEYFRMIIHDLQTPLSALSGVALILRQLIAESDDPMPYAAIEADLDQLHRVTQSLLDYLHGELPPS